MSKFPEVKQIKTPSPHWVYFKILYQDFEKSLEYVHPMPSHYKVYSLRNYEFLLRACTEFESVCKTELYKSGKALPNEHLNITRYFELESHYRRKLSSYQVGFNFNPQQFMRPLGNWANSHSLTWYQSYNFVKHNREAKFEEASLENVMNAIAGLFVLLVAAELCPKGDLAFNENKLIRWNEEWPLLIAKDEGDHVYNPH